MQPGEQGSDQPVPRGPEASHGGAGSARAAPEGPPRAVDRPARSMGAAAAGAGLQFAVSLVLFVFLGQWLDRRLGTAPVFLLVCVFVGAGGSFFGMYRMLMAAQRREDEARALEAARRTRARES